MSRPPNARSLRGPRQLGLDLRTWGGRRRGAGRKPRDARAGVSHGSRPPVASGHPVHVTLRVRRHVFNLRARRCQRVLEAAFTAARERNGLRLVHYSVQGNHLHLLVEAQGRTSLSRGMQGLTIRLARALNRVMGRRGKVFADRFHGHVLRSPREVRNALRYVLGNAQRHGTWRRAERRGPLFDPCASGRFFDGWRGPLPATAALAEPGHGSPVSPPRTWLLRVGWRRGGLIPVP